MIRDFRDFGESVADLPPSPLQPENFRLSENLSKPARSQTVHRAQAEWKGGCDSGTFAWTDSIPYFLQTNKLIHLAERTCIA
jgi:hypothetical protein